MTESTKANNKCSIEMFIKLALTLFFKRQQHRKLSWLDKDRDKDQSQFDEISIEHVLHTYYLFLTKY
jgi:hypothetical protein